MGDSRTVDREYLRERFDTVRETVRRERRRTVIERRAFAAFSDRIRQLDLEDPSPASTDHSSAVSTPGGAMASPALAVDGPDPTDAIRRAYEETVMAVPFYEEEYGDSYEESIRAEFGPEIATAITQPQCFGPPTKRALYAATQRATGERTYLIKTCNQEHESIDVAADTLLPLVSELDRTATERIDTEPFGTLEAQWKRIGTLREHCDGAATARQQDIDELRARFDLPIEAPDICVYLYQGLDAAYPVLAGCASIAARFQTVQDRYEQAMAEY